MLLPGEMLAIGYVLRVKPMKPAIREVSPLIAAAACTEASLSVGSACASAAISSRRKTEAILSMRNLVRY